MLAADPSSSLAPWLADAFQHNAEIVVIFDKLKHVGDDVSSAGIGHDALHLTHLMQPKISQIVINRIARLAPELQRPL